MSENSTKRTSDKPHAGSVRRTRGRTKGAIWGIGVLPNKQTGGFRANEDRLFWPCGYHKALLAKESCRQRWEMGFVEEIKCTPLLRTTEGNEIHYGFIEEFIEALGAQHIIQEIAFDRWEAVQMTQNLEGLGFTVVPFG